MDVDRARVRERCGDKHTRARRRAAGDDVDGTRRGGVDADDEDDGRRSTGWIHRRANAMVCAIGKPVTFTVRAARHARKKATKGHNDTRPKKSSPSQRKRQGSTEYAVVDPASAPAVMTIVSK